MSYNVWLEAEFKNSKQPVQLGQSYNITYNLAGMFRATVGSTPKEWNGMRASELLPKLTDGINKLTFQPDYYIQYEAAKGWGRIENCQKFLMRIAALCRKYPFATVREE